MSTTEEAAREQQCSAHVVSCLVIQLRSAVDQACQTINAVVS